jgi:hypothetical protein
MKGTSENEPLEEIQRGRGRARLLAGHDPDASDSCPDCDVNTVSKGK